MTIALLGSGEFTEAMEEIDRFVLKGVENPIVAIVPLAAKKEADYRKWVEMGERHFEKLGMEAYGAETAEELKRANVVYFSGGDPGYLLEQVKGEIWEEAIKKQVICGSSAGAMLLGEWMSANIYAVIDNGEKKLQWEKAMGAVPYTVWPHFDWALREIPEKIKEFLDQAPKSDWLGIDEDTAVIFPSRIVLGRGVAHWCKI